MSRNLGSGSAWHHRRTRCGLAVLAVTALMAGALVVGPSTGSGAAPLFTVTNTEATGGTWFVHSGDLVVFPQRESNEGDLNGDGDTADISVPAVWDTSTGTLTSLGLAIPGGPAQRVDYVSVDADIVAVGVSEAGQGGTDLNGDGDTDDEVAHVWQRSTGTVTNLGLATESYDTTVASGGAVAVGVRESDQGGTDLDGDGDTLDSVAHVWTPVAGITNLGLPLIFFSIEAREGLFAFAHDVPSSSDDAYGMYDAATETLTNLGATPGGGPTTSIDFADGWVALSASEGGGSDLNGDGDTTDRVLQVWDGLAASPDNVGVALAGSGTWIWSTDAGFLVAIAEPAEGGTDLNGDGDANDNVAHIWNAGAGLTNLGVALSGGSLLTADDLELAGGGAAAFTVNEGSQGNTDLNGDGDADDDVAHIWSPASGLIDTGLAAVRAPVAGPGGIGLYATEAGQGAMDLNGDGDATDFVAHAWSESQGLTNLGLAHTAANELGVAPAGEGIGFNIFEAASGGADLNSNGNTNDRLLFAWIPTTGDLTLALTPSASVLSPVQHRTESAGLGRFAVTVAESSVATDLNSDGDTTDQVVHIVSVDANPPPSIAVGDATLVEGDTGVRSLSFPVTLSEPATETTTVAYTITAGTATAGTAKTPGADFNHKAGNTKTLTFKVGNSGTTPVTKFVTVPIYPDTSNEGDETFTVTLSSPSSGSALARAIGTGTITDDDATPKGGTEISAGDVTIVEGESGRRVAKAALTLSGGAAGEVRVDYTVVSGTAACGPSKKQLPLDPADDCDDRKGVTKTAVFKIGAAKKLLPGFVFPDTMPEGDESFTVVLSNPVGATIRDGSAVITIHDDD